MAHLLDPVPQELGVPDEAPEAAAVPWVAHVLGYLEVLLAGRSHGMRRDMAGPGLEPGARWQQINSRSFLNAIEY